MEKKSYLLVLGIAVLVVACAVSVVLLTESSKRKKNEEALEAAQQEAEENRREAERIAALTGTPTPTSTPTSAPIDTSYTSGGISGRFYINLWANVSVKVPEDWVIANQSEPALLAQLKQSNPEADVALLAYKMKGQLPLAMCIVVCYKGQTNLEDSMKFLAESQLPEVEGVRIQVEPNKRVIGGEEYHIISMTTTEDASMKMEMAFRECHGNGTFAITAFSFDPSYPTEDIFRLFEKD